MKKMRVRGFVVQFGIVLILLSVGLCCLEWEEIVIAFQSPVDIYVEPPEEIKKLSAVDTNLRLVLGKFASVETRDWSWRGIRSTHISYFYVVPVYAGGQTYFVALEVGAEDKSKYDTLVMQTRESLNGGELPDGIRFTGGFERLDTELYMHMREWALEYGEIGVEQYFLPFKLKPVNFRFVRNMVRCVEVGVIAGVVIVFSFVFMEQKKKYSIRKKKKSLTIEIAGVKYPYLTFKNVDWFIKNNEKVRAIKEIREITGLGLAEAKEVAFRWDEYVKF